MRRKYCHLLRGSRNIDDVTSWRLKQITSKMTSNLDLGVGGFRYTLDADDIRKFPTGRLATMLVNSAPEEIFKIDRDGRVFQYVASYLVSRRIPQNEHGLIRLDPLTLVSLREEAKYFGLDQLFDECDRSCIRILNSDFHTHLNMHKYIQNVKRDSIHGEGALKVDYIADSTTPLLHALSAIWVPSFLTGEFNEWYGELGPNNLFEGCSIDAPKIDDLIARATVDPEESHAYSIPIGNLDEQGVEDILSMFTRPVSLAPQNNVTFACDRLLIHSEGYSHDFRSVLSARKAEGHIGTLVVILNSTYTGGELEVTHGGRTEVVTGPYSWVAMYGDCLHKINLVTSGTRVSLIFDIYLSPNNPSPKLENSVSLLQKANKGTDLRTATASVTTDAAVVAADHHLDNNSQASSSEHSSAVYSTSDEQEQQEEEPEENNDLIDFDEEIPSDSYADSDFWNRSYREVAANLDERVRGADSALQVRIRQALDKELTNFDTIIICLRHLYPECQTHPSALKGGDRVLYDILLSNTTTTDDSTAGTSSTSSSADSTSESIYEVQVVAATIYRANDPAFHLGNVIQGRLFSPAIVQQTLTQEANSVNAASVNDHASEPASKKLRSEHRTKLVIPNAMHCDNFLDYSPYQAYTGNDSQAEETVYIVAGLQVRRKAV